MPKPETYSYIGSREGQKAQAEVMASAQSQTLHEEKVISALPRNCIGTDWQVLTMSKIIGWEGPVIWEYSFEYSENKNSLDPNSNKIRRIEEDFPPVEFPKSRWL